MPIAEFALIMPIVFLLAASCMVLLVGLIPGTRPATMYALAQAGLLLTAVLAASGHVSAPMTAFGGMFVRDSLSDTLDIVVCLLASGTLVYSRTYLRDRGMYRAEYFVLAMFGVLGMMIINSAGHFLSLYLGLELMSLSMYSMLAFQRDSARATEAAMKYFILGALASGLLLYGLSMLYGVTHTLSIPAVAQAIAALPPGNMVLIFGLVFVVVGLGFKLGAVPFHMWVPDVYDGAPTAVTLYISTAPKVAALALFLRLLVGGLSSLSSSWQEMIIILAFLSIVLGNVVAIAQQNLKRMLAYSAISHMGFALLGIASARAEGYAAAVFYLIVYAVMSLGAFGLLALLSHGTTEIERIDDLKGLNQRSPWYAFLMLLLMFGMAGVPPTAGFYAKLLVIQAVVDVHLIWLAVTAVLFSVVGAFYYLRVVKVMYFDAPETQEPIVIPFDGGVLLGLNGLSMLLLTPWVASLLSVCRAAVAGLP